MSNVIFRDALVLEEKRGPDILLEVTWRDDLGEAPGRKGLGELRVTFKARGQDRVQIAAHALEKDAVRFAHYIEAHLGKIAPGFRREPAWHSVRHRLKALGWRATAWILPLRLLEKVREVHRDSLYAARDAGVEPAPLSLSICTNESWIPWELVYDPELEGFWGEVFVLSRKQSEEEGSRTPTISWRGPAPAFSESSLVLSVVGDRTGSGGMASDLWRHYPQLTVRQNAPAQGRFFSVATLIDSIQAEQAQIIHVTCHGEVDEAGERYLRLGPQPEEHFLYAFDVPLVDIRGRLLFLNACCAVAPHRAEFGPWEGLKNFGWLLGLRKTGALIGTYAPISAKAAHEFARVFYTHFLGAGETVGNALYKTKQQLAREHKPFGLVYSLYGDPDLKMSLSNKPAAEIQ